jgi:hypothetical protein
MNLEADAMPQPVRETIPKSSCRKAGTRYRIKFHRPRPRDCGLASGPLSTLDGGMKIDLPGIGFLPDDERSRHVRVVPVNQRTAIDNQQVTAGQRRAIGAVMGHGRVCACADDGVE